MCCPQSSEGRHPSLRKLSVSDHARRVKPVHANFTSPRLSRKSGRVGGHDVGLALNFPVFASTAVYSECSPRMKPTINCNHRLYSGIGAGTKDFDKHPNILRVIIGDVSAIPPELRPDPVDHLYQSNKREHEDWSTRRLCMFEANIDDMTGEVAGHLMEKLLGDGCLDTWLSPVFMKKNRPAYTVHVLCESNDQHHIMRLLFMESTTLGVRRYFVERCSLRRQMVTSSTPFGDVQMKVRRLCTCLQSHE